MGFSGDGGPATAALLHRCRGLSANENGIYIADQSNNRVRKIDTNGITFELFHTMINRIEETQFLSWDEIESLE